MFYKSKDCFFFVGVWSVLIDEFVEYVKLLIGFKSIIV